jgi:peptidyl-tRNA hydrolase, PTH1 family
MKLVVGLGNPGARYHGTRHNVGFAVADYLASGVGVGPWKRRFQAHVAECPDGDETLLLIKPETFMNLSGNSVRQATDFYKVPAEAILVVCDDIALPLGKLRVRASGSHGGHNGLRDIEAHLGTNDYARLRIGVGAPDSEAVDHVLGRFRPSELPLIEDAIARAAAAVLVWSREGVEACMNKYNGPPVTDAPKKRPKDEQEPSDGI